MNPQDLSSVYFPVIPDPSQDHHDDILEKHDNSGNGEENAINYISPSIEIAMDADGNDDHSHSTTATSSKGRCLIATRDIEPGELLFIETPLVSANVDTVMQSWITSSLSITARTAADDENSQPPPNTVAQLSEQVLLQTCMEAMENNIAIQNALSCLQGSSAFTSTGGWGGKEEGKQRQQQDATAMKIPSWDRLLGRDHTICNSSKKVDDVLQTIRRNAFGPDFITNEQIQQKWMEYNNTKNDDNTESRNSMSNMFRPSRLLGLYPIAAMLNHSCIPNAVRVYVATTTQSSSSSSPPPQREYMIVHACQKIQAGEEIVWSYIPVIQSFPQRQSLLQQTHGFVCQCRRCQIEKTIWDESEQLQSLSNRIMGTLPETVETQTNADNEVTPADAFSLFFTVYAPAIAELENEILNNCDAKWSNEVKRYIRIGFLEWYMEYLNGALYWLLQQSPPPPSAKYSDPDDSKTSTTTTTTTCIPTRADLLSLCTQLHFSLAACHNASTEHLSVCVSMNDIIASSTSLPASLFFGVPLINCHPTLFIIFRSFCSLLFVLLQILHLCYELISTIHVSSGGTETAQLRFWTEQLKRAVMIRYGATGNQLESVRRMMQHTRTVLRSKNGLDQVEHKFI